MHCLLSPRLFPHSLYCDGWAGYLVCDSLDVHAIGGSPPIGTLLQEVVFDRTNRVPVTLVAIMVKFLLDSKLWCGISDVHR